MAVDPSSSDAAREGQQGQDGGSRENPQQFLDRELIAGCVQDNEHDDQRHIPRSVQHECGNRLLLGEEKPAHGEVEILGRRVGGGCRHDRGDILVGDQADNERHGDARE
jgi:hypothetical protein